MIRLVLFDIDGTLVQTGGAGGRALERAWQEVFGVADGLGGIRLGGRTDASLFQELYTRHRIPFEPAAHERFVAAYLHLLCEYLEAYRGELLLGARELIRAWRSIAPRTLVGLLTGNVRLAAEIKLRRFDVWEEFELGAFGDDHPCRNELAALARRRGQGVLSEELEGREIVVIGDTLHDIECARSIGAICVAVATGSDCFDVLQAARPDVLVRDLRDLDVSELLRFEEGRSGAPGME